MRRRLVSSDEAVPSSKQHTTPCGDCPWRRDSLPGWTGGIPPDTWVRGAHGEERIDCHTKVGPQCAGAAIYRANVCKSPRDPEVLQLKKDKVKVFAGPGEFMEHHS